MDFVQDNPGEPVPEETFTHLHLSWSSIVPYLLLPCTTIHGILPVQSICLEVFFHNLSLQVFFGLPVSLAHSTSYSIHFFTQSLPSFRNTCPYHRNLTVLIFIMILLSALVSPLILAWTSVALGIFLWPWPCILWLS